MTPASDGGPVVSAEKAPLPTLDDFGPVFIVPTRWEDNDHYGHINNVVYYSFFDTAVNLWLLEATGVDIRTLPEIGVVVSSGCHFLRSLSFPDEVAVGLAVRRIGNSSVTYRLGVFKSGEREARALGEFVHVYVDSGGRTTVPIPAVIRAALEGLPLVSF